MKKVWAVIEDYEDRYYELDTQEFWLFSTLEKAKKGFQERLDYVIEQFGGEDQIDDKTIEGDFARVRCEGAHVCLHIKEMDVK